MRIQLFSVLSTGPMLRDSETRSMSGSLLNMKFKLVKRGATKGLPLLFEEPRAIPKPSLELLIQTEAKAILKQKQPRETEGEGGPLGGRCIGGRANAKHEIVCTGRR